MLCDACREVVPDGAKFCEACGADVVAAPTGASPAAATPNRACVSCGADGALIDADGYCGQCGFKQPAPRDHLEIDGGTIAGVTDKGIRHFRNEDAMAFCLVDADGVDNAIVAVVCDGVSTTVRPDDASQAAADAACAVLAAAVRERPDELPAAMQEAAVAAQAAVVAVPFSAADLAATDPPLGAPSCTFVAAVRLGDAVTVGCIGDSRAYWLDGSGVATALTVDDSWAFEQVAAGVMDIDAAMADSRAHTITQWLGADAPPIEARPEVLTLPGPGRLLLCSDGLWNYAEHAEALAARVGEASADATPLQLAQHLTNFAKDSGGHDNITVVIADVGAPIGAPVGAATPVETEPT